MIHLPAMKLYHLLSIAVGNIVLAVFPAFALEGPLQVRNQFPVFLPVHQPPLEQAVTRDSWSVSLSHSSVYIMEDAQQWSAHLDLELTELNLRFKKDFTGCFELGVDIPVLRVTAGFMDRPLAWYHRAFGFPDYGRSERPRNELAYEVRKEGSLVVRGDNDRAGVGDIRLALKKKILEGDALIISGRFDAELPTGNARVGYGSGSLDAGAALLLDGNISVDTRIYANAGFVVPGDLKAHQTINLRTFYYAGAGLEYLYDPSLGLIAQAMLQTSPFPETGISQIDTAAVWLALGGRYYLNPGSIEFSLIEDPNTSGAPDFIVNLTYTRLF